MFDVNIIQRILLVEFDITLKENVFINICPQVSPAISAKKLVDHEPEETGKNMEKRTVGLPDTSTITLLSS